MAQTHKILRRLLVDSGAALIGLVIGLVYIEFFRNGVALPLSGPDGLILISSTFVALLLSSVFSYFVVGLTLKFKRDC